MKKINSQNSILIIDDEPVVLKSMTSNMRQEGFKVVPATSGEEALKLFQENFFDLVLTDLSLPGMSGIEVAKQVKALKPETSVIVLTGYGGMPTAIEALRVGADDYMLKPCDLDELIIRINQCHTRRARNQELRRHKEIISTTDDRIAMISPQHTHLLVNRAYAESVGICPEDLIGSRIEDIFGGKFFSEKMACLLTECMSGKTVQNEEFWSCDGKPPRFLNFTYTPSFSDDGMVSAITLNIRDLTDFQKMSQELQENAHRLRLALDVTSNGVWDRNLLTGKVHYGEQWASLLGYTLEEVISKKFRFTDLLHPDDKEKVQKIAQDHFDGKTVRYVAEFRLKKKNGDWQWILARGKVVERDDDGRAVRFVGTHTDINCQKEAELKLLETNNRLEEMVQQRTEQLKRKTDDLEQYNSALTVLLKKREQDKTNLEEQMVSNIKMLISPYLEKLKRSQLTKDQAAWVNIIQTNHNHVLSPFLHRVSLQHLSFTPTEIQVANMIKDGCSSKEIADLMNLSPETVSNHRKHIRKKTGITNKKTNLRTILTSFENS